MKFDLWHEESLGQGSKVNDERRNLSNSLSEWGIGSEFLESSYNIIIIVIIYRSCRRLHYNNKPLVCVVK